MIQKHLPAGETLPPVPGKQPVMSIPAISLTQRATLFANLPKPVVAEHPLCFEDLGQAYGFVLYRTTLKNAASGLLKIKEMRDYATLYINGKRIGSLDRHLRQDSIQISNSSANATLDILLENNGRINYGPYLTDNRQGITEKVTLNGTELTGWEMYKFPFTDLKGFVNKIASNQTIKAGWHTEIYPPAPALYSGKFTLKSTADTYLDMKGFGKGFVFLNGHNLGKYWNIGPQQTLYIPASWLKVGVNEISIFDELKSGHTSINALDHPILNVVLK